MTARAESAARASVWTRTRLKSWPKRCSKKSRASPSRGPPRDRSTWPTIGGTEFFFVQRRETSFAVDVGAILEFYPTKRVVTRFDFGIPIIHYSRHTTTTPVFDPVTGTYRLGTAIIPADTQGSLQVMASVGFRF